MTETGDTGIDIVTVNTVFKESNLRYFCADFDNTPGTFDFEVFHHGDGVAVSQRVADRVTMTGVAVSGSSESSRGHSCPHIGHTSSAPDS